MMSINGMIDQEMKPFCRACLAISNLKCMRSPAGDFRPLFEDVTSIQIPDDDPHPAFLCDACLQAIQNAQKIKRQCLEVDTKLKEVKVTVKIEYAPESGEENEEYNKIVDECRVKECESMESTSQADRPRAMLLNGPKIKLKRKRISLEQKAQILERIKCGEKIHKISEELNISRSTIAGIQLREDKIRKRISIGSLASINKTARIKNNLLACTENCLMRWIEDCRQNNLPLEANLIKRKAIELFEYLKEKECDSKEKFAASNGWFDGFKRRFSLNNIKLQKI